MLCLVTGASGYIGGRLVPRLLAAGHAVRCVVRDPSKLRDMPWRDEVEVVRGNVLDKTCMDRACHGVDVVYYLVHSLNQADFAATDHLAAEITAAAAHQAHVGRIVYLGGVRPDDESLSEHLRSRAEIAEVLLRSGVPTVVLQAAVIIGSGSASFEMLRYLTERLPIMVTPRWVRNRVQPIAVRDVLHYLVGAAELPAGVHRTFDIAGPTVLTYAQMMQRYAAVANLPKRVMLPVKVLSPRLSSHWINIVTPVPKSIGQPLIESLVHEAVRAESDIDAYLPPPAGGLTGYEHAVRLALQRIDQAQVETRWSDASHERDPGEALPSDPSWAGGSAYTDTRRRHSTAPPDHVWRIIASIGGSTGWYSFPLAWAVRGWADRLLGGVGLRRGRRHPNQLRVGEALDWWRVEDLEDGRLLRLRAEMKVPGKAWLELRVEADGSGGSTYCQRAVYVPHGLAGHAYWWSVTPFHSLVFGGMARNIVRAAERLASDGRREHWSTEPEPRANAKRS